MVSPQASGFPYRNLVATVAWSWTEVTEHVDGLSDLPGEAPAALAAEMWCVSVSATPTGLDERIDQQRRLPAAFTELARAI